MLLLRSIVVFVFLITGNHLFSQKFVDLQINIAYSQHDTIVGYNYYDPQSWFYKNYSPGFQISTGAIFTHYLSSHVGYRIGLSGNLALEHIKNEYSAYPTSPHDYDNFYYRYEVSSASCWITLPVLACIKLKDPVYEIHAGIVPAMYISGVNRYFGYMHEGSVFSDHYDITWNYRRNAIAFNFAAAFANVGLSAYITKNFLITANFLYGKVYNLQDDLAAKNMHMISLGVSRRFCLK